ncbi:hypothetical protein KX729_23380 [Rhizobium sp. XQZ8]|uniref:hypothetical protein n=1 Tax=Rhizobium populisoli TaxID=2859785 RepID=UPI001CA4F75B|nr:hypothetical protein [Rhizobium populisoli]MBW6424399.1 hypothetical protein [Rhizobium populisoli]
METSLYAYQMSPGKDDLLWFTTTAEDCERAAREQREDMRRELGEGGVIGAMAVYRSFSEICNHSNSRWF